MARITGTIPRPEIENLSPRKLDDLVQSKHRELIERHGHGLLYTSSNPATGDVTYTFDYAEQFDAPPPGSSLVLNPHVEPVDDELLRAVKTARVKMCNMSAVKQAPDGTYVPIDAADVNAQNTCDAINRLERLLAKHDPEGRVLG